VAAPAAREVTDQFGTQDLAARGGGFEALGFDDGQPEAVVVGEGHVADTDADAHVEPLQCAPPVVPVDCLLDPDRGCHGSRGERRHHAVTGVFHDRAALSRDGIGDERVVRDPQRVRGLLADACSQCGRADDVSEEDSCGVDARLGGSH
jgi:hypothetical protein